MVEWARRMHRRAVFFSDVITSCGHLHTIRRVEKVKFGVPLESFCHDDVPGPLLVLILKINKEGPVRKDVFRAPGHEIAMKKLQHRLQSGRLINFDHYSVHTVASIIKKFLRKIPGGIFTMQGEMKLFASLQLPLDKQLEETRNVISALPVATQKLLCDLLGTFKAIDMNAATANTGMTAEAIGVSVAPSFFHSCVSDGKTATIGDVQRFKVATRILRFLIEQFTEGSLFERAVYEHYARVSGRIFTVNRELMCTLMVPTPPKKLSEQPAYIAQLALQEGKTWLQCECDRWNSIRKSEGEPLSGMQKEDSCSMPILCQAGPSGLCGLDSIPEDTLLDTCTRLSSSLEDTVFVDSKQCPSHPHSPVGEDLLTVTVHAHNAKSMDSIPHQVLERRNARMRTRSEWFISSPALGPAEPRCGGSPHADTPRTGRGRGGGGRGRRARAPVPRADLCRAPSARPRSLSSHGK